MAPGRKSFSGPGGPDVAAFTADLDVNESLVWTNATTIESMQRSQPLQVAWTGGTAGSQVVIIGTSSSGFTSFPVESATFQCLAEPQAGSFTVPREVLNEMIPSPAATPVPTGSLGVGTATVSSARLPGFDQTFVGYTDITSKSVRVF